MFCDLHIHTSEYSHCAGSSAQEICVGAINAGLEGIALTEHDVWWPRDRVERLRDEFPELVIMRGIEYATADGHFLLFLPDSQPELLPRSSEVPDLVSEIHGAGGIVVWAHPFRWDGNVPHWLESVRIDGMETESSNMDRRAGAKADQVAEAMGIMQFRNSDSHHWRALGKYGNLIPDPVKGIDDLIAYVKGGRQAKVTG